MKPLKEKQMRKLVLTIVAFLIAVPAFAADKESAYDRVIRTGTLRCGYALWPPTAMAKDPKTGEMTGIFVEIAEEMAENLNVKLEWTEETGWGSFIESLQSNRFDLFCAPLWRNAERGRLISYTVPLAYSALHLYARAGDERFDKDIAILNSADYKLATMDGEMSQIVARRFFPNAQQVSIPQLGDITQLVMDVATGKADAVFLEPSLAYDFAKKNPGKIRQVTKEPYQVFPDSFGMLIGEEKFKDMIDSALIEMMNQGAVDRIIEKYEPDRSIFMPVQKPYVYIAPKTLP